MEPPRQHDDTQLVNQSILFSRRCGLTVDPTHLDLRDFNRFRRKHRHNCRENREHHGVRAM